MQQWLGETIPSLDEEDEDLIWSETPDRVENLLEKFRAVRAEQISLLPEFDEAAWHATREAVWGPVTLLWVVSKTYQHTAEHTNDVMRIGLFWDSY
ncbi:MAG TPA: DinB family protein, partial [Anaerolineales bacterium]|nr:DinB family protein [Anaerolineales bacterium]